jgi:predicted porin
MQKSLIALAALATLSGAALAQSSVTIYGRLDASVGGLDTGAGNQNQMFSGNLTTSRLGFRGTEDLGGGLKANFQLEQGLNVINGQTNASGGGGVTFNRASWVGLSGGFGGITLGLRDSAYKDAYDLGNAHNVFDSEFTPVKAAYQGAAAVNVGDFTSRPASQIRYDSPKFGGFSGAASYAFDQTAGTESDITAFHLRYAGGPLDVALGFQQQNSLTAASDRDYTVLSGIYNFGAFRVSAQYQNAETSANLKDNDFAIGVSMPLGAFEVSAGYATSESKQGGAKVREGSGFALGATYALSKRTRLYGAYLDGDTENAAGTTVTERKLYAVGVRHDF